MGKWIGGTLEEGEGAVLGTGQGPEAADDLRRNLRLDVEAEPAPHD
jgi:hypothetical protein